MKLPTTLEFVKGIQEKVRSRSYSTVIMEQAKSVVAEDYFEDVIKALEKQEGYEVKVTGHNNAIGVDVGECECGAMVRSIFNYCPDCGKKLLW